MRKLTRDNLPHLIDCLVRRLRIQRDSWLMQLRAQWWGVTLGDQCWFHGRSYFRRHPSSRIAIGDRCGFNSSASSNLIGVNRPCILSTLRPDAEIVIGHDCGFSGTVIGSAIRVVLGNSVRCGANTLITDTDWHCDDPRTCSDAPVIIEDNVWLGIDVTVLKGVTIGKNTLVGAGSLVTANLPSNVIAAGIPAKIIKRIAV